MLTVSQLAKRFNITRSTIIYYEKKGILLPFSRSENGYRWYGKAEIDRLKMIIAYRSFGLPIVKLTSLIKRENGLDQESILKDQFTALEQEILILRKQQKAIVQFLKEPIQQENTMVTKERWVEIMKAAGLSDDDMLNWHRKFEELEPNEHQKFLESLSITPDEITRIRKL